MPYYQGFLLPVPNEKKDAYVEMATSSAPFFAKHGAQRIVEAWQDDVPRGETTDMYRAVDAQDGESIVFAWVDWGSKEGLQKAHDTMTQDEEMEEPHEMPFDGKRMMYHGFDLLGESGAGGKVGYVQGYIAPVPKARREAFEEMCAAMRDVAIDCGALFAVDNLAEDIPDGKVTDFKRAVKAGADEAVAFGWVEWPSKEAFQAGSAKMREHENMPPPTPDMPVDGKRLILGGFEPILDTNAGE